MDELVKKGTILRPRGWGDLFDFSKDMGNAGKGMEKAAVK